MKPTHTEPAWAPGCTGWTFTIVGVLLFVLVSVLFNVK